MGEETFNFHVSHYGDFFRCMRRLDAPSIDCLTSIPSNVSWLAALYAGSARELNGARYTMSETSDHCERNRKTVYQVCEGEVNGTLNRLLWGGINTFTSYYSFRGFKDDALRRINVRLGRLNTLRAWRRSRCCILPPTCRLRTCRAPLCGTTRERPSVRLRTDSWRVYGRCTRQDAAT